MLSSLYFQKKPLFWFTFHVFLGIVSTFSTLPLILYFYLIFLLSFPLIVKQRRVNTPLNYLISYLISFEILTRMANTSPFIPYELGKYFTFFILLAGIFFGKNKGYIGVFLIFLLLPAFFYDYSNQVGFTDIIFNCIGPINVGLAIWYFYKQHITARGFYQLIVLMSLPLVSVLSFTIFKLPDFNDIQFSLAANFDTTGGFGSNQVSTVLGLGFFLIFFLWSHGIKFTGKRTLDLGLMGAFFFQGLLTFSRGGLLGGVLGVLILLYYSTRISKSSLMYKGLKKGRKFILPAMILVFILVVVSNNITGGLLLQRYQGKTYGTMLGAKEKNLNTLTTGRYEIFLGDWELFKDYFWTGVGAGASRYLREFSSGIITHVEMGRLLAEHGILGLVYFLILLFLIFQIILMPNANAFKGFLLSCFFIGLFTSFHSATRTFVTPLLIGLSTITIIHEKNFIPR